MLFSCTQAIPLGTLLFLAKVSCNPVETLTADVVPYETPPTVPAKTVQPRAYSVKPDSAGGRPWPNNKLSYCFKDQATQGALEPIVHDAWDLWRSAGNIRNLQIDRRGNCDKIDGINGYPLIISRNTNKKLETSLGFRAGLDREKKPPNNMQYDDINFKKIGYEDNTINMAHELGHAMGLLHEHQRPDAPNFVRFHCENLFDYDNIKNKEGEEHMRELCQNRNAAEDERFSAVQWIPRPPGENAFDQEGNYDRESIMHYLSEAGSKSRYSNVPPFLRKANLVLTDLSGRELPFKPKKPSPHDIQRINKLYP